MGIRDKIKWLFTRNSENRLQEPIYQCLQKIGDVEERLGKMQKRERRHTQLQEAMYEEFSAKLNNLQNQIDAEFPLDSVYDFALGFALYAQEHSDQDPALERLWHKFNTMLANLGAEIILDRNKAFDDSRHQACDTRFDPGHPEGVILDVVQPGIKLHDQIKKPAVVVVNQFSLEKQA